MISGQVWKNTISVVGAVHHEFEAFGNGTELPDNQFVTDEIIEMRDVLLKLVRTIHVIIISVIPDMMIRGFFTTFLM